MIVCVLVMKFVCVFVDELIGNFDGMMVDMVFNLMFELFEMFEMSFVIVMYDFDFVVCCDCIMWLCDGVLYEELVLLV